MSFDSLGLRAELLRAVSDAGYTTPTSVQSQTIPLVLGGRDLLAGAQTGTGKTAGFTLPILQLLSERPPAKAQPTSPLHKHTGPRGKNGGPRFQEPRAVRVLVLVPTRELAMQVEESVQTYGRHLPKIRSAAVFGGVDIGRQIKAFRKGVEVLVATPGRLQDHVARNTVDLSRVEILVLDEADRMLDMGFIKTIREIIRLLPKKRQNLLFSATISNEIRDLSGEFLNSPEHIQVAQRNAAPELVEQLVHPVDRKRKRALLSHKIKTGDWQQVLVFTRTKHGANRLSEQLKTDGISSLAIHGNKSQGARTQALKAFKGGRVRVLVATDIAARGLDIDQLPHVVNYELPHVPEDYLHRIGRTGRAGNEGTAVSLVCVDEHGLLRGIERLLRRELPQEITQGYEPDLTIRPEPITKGRASAGGNSMKRRPGQGGRPSHGPRPFKARGERSRQGSGNGAGNGSGAGSSARGRKSAGNGISAGRRHGAANGAGSTGHGASSRNGATTSPVENTRPSKQRNARGRGAAAPAVSNGRPSRKPQSPSRRRRAARRAAAAGA